MLALPSELTQQQAAGCLNDLCQGIHTAPRKAVEINASALKKFDSSALAVLLACQREAIAARKTMKVREMPLRLQELAVLYGISELIPTMPAAAA